MSDYKLIAFDMDGTLLDSDKKIRQDSINAIAKAVECGKYVALSTGRSVPEINDYLPYLKDVKYIMSSSGSYIYTNPDNEIIFDRPLDDGIITEVFERTKNYDLMWHLHGFQGYVQTNQVSHLENYGMEIYRNLFATLDKNVDNLPQFYSENKVGVYKFNCYCRTPKQREIIRKHLDDLNITIAYSETTSIEISPKGISKASGLKQLCDHLNIPVAEAIAVGDGDNDLEILKLAGLSVAMGNSKQTVFDVADVVVKDNDHGGCAQAVYDYLLNPHY